MSHHINAVRIKPEGAREIVVMLTSRPQVQIKDGVISVQAEKLDLQWDISSHVSTELIHVETEDYIKELPQTTTPLFCIDHHQIAIYGIAPDSEVMLFTIAGKMQGRYRADDLGNVTIDLQDSGIFVVKTNLGNYKLIKK